MPKTKILFFDIPMGPAHILYKSFVQMFPNCECDFVNGAKFHLESFGIKLKSADLCFISMNSYKALSWLPISFTRLDFRKIVVLNPSLLSQPKYLNYQISATIPEHITCIPDNYVFEKKTPQIPRRIHIPEHITCLPDNYVFEKKTPQIPRRLHMAWIGNNPIPEFAKEHAAKWPKLMPDWEFLFWTNDDLRKLPNDVQELLERAEKGVQKADLLKYYLLEIYGGIYVDADVIPWASLDPIIEMGEPIILCHDLELTWEYYMCAVMAAKAGTRIFKRACELCHTAVLNTEDIHMQTGPRLFGKAVFNVDEPCVNLPHFYFYRNRKGETSFTQSPMQLYNRDKDFEGRFGAHMYAREWG